MATEKNRTVPAEDVALIEMLASKLHEVPANIASNCNGGCQGCTS